MRGVRGEDRGLSGPLSVGIVRRGGRLLRVGGGVGFGFGFGFVERGEWRGGRRCGLGRGGGGRRWLFRGVGGGMVFRRVLRG